jgi:hypothetical protein
MCIFVVLCVDETLFYMREYSDAVKLPKSFFTPFLRAIEMHRKRNISAECECIAKYIWSHF